MKDSKSYQPGDQYSTRQAAEFLRVSQASVRRWADAGLLQVRRVGSRRERRFTEAALRHFADQGQPPGRPPAVKRPDQVRLGAGWLRTGSHVATYYAGDAGRTVAAAPFFAEGLEIGARCLLIASEPLRHLHFDGLRRRGVDYEQMLRAGRLVAVDGPGRTARAAVEYMERLFWDAMRDGPAQVRLVAEMAAVSARFRSAGEMLGFEAELNGLARRFPTVIVCQYDVREFNGPQLLQALKAHPDAFGLGMGSFLL